MNNKNFKRTIRHYEFLIEDLEDVQSIYEIANHEMNSEILKLKPKDSEKKENIPVNEEKIVETFEDTVERKELKKLFRSIVKVSHPDKISDTLPKSEINEIVLLYETAVKALDTNNWGLMIITAIKLDIEIPKKAESVINKIQEECEDIEKKIDAMTKSLPWKWYHSDSDTRKKMVDDYIKALENIRIRKENAKDILLIGYPCKSFMDLISLIKSWGVDLKYETISISGTASWRIVFTGHKDIGGIDFNFKSYEWKNIIYYAPDAKYLLEEHLNPSNEILNILETLELSGKRMSADIIASIVEFDKIAGSVDSDLIVKSNDDIKILFDFLSKKTESNLNWKQPTKNNINIDPNSIGILTREKRSLNAYCNMHGYPDFFKL